MRFAHPHFLVLLLAAGAYAWWRWPRRDKAEPGALAFPGLAASPTSRHAARALTGRAVAACGRWR